MHELRDIDNAIASPRYASSLFPTVEQAAEVAVEDWLTAQGLEPLPESLTPREFTELATFMDGAVSSGLRDLAVRPSHEEIRDILDELGVGVD